MLGPPGREGMLAAAMLVCVAIAGCGGGSRVGGHQAARSDPPATGVRRAVRRAAPVAAYTAGCKSHAPPERQIVRREWLSGVTITEYYPLPELGRHIDVYCPPTPSPSARVACCCTSACT
jgi:hypothetical protein